MSARLLLCALGAAYGSSRGPGGVCGLGQEAFDASCLLQSVSLNVSGAAEPGGNRTANGTAGEAPAGRYELLKVGGPWGGLEELMHMIMTDLPDDLRPHGGDCDVFYLSGWVFSVLAWDGLTKPLPAPPLRNPAAFVVVNQEFPENEYVWKWLPKGYVDHAIILGNWWNSTHADYSDERVTSMWVPFGSLSFAGRKLSNPMNLTSRANASWREKMQRCSQKYLFGGKGPLPREVAYMQRSCFTSWGGEKQPWSNYREKFWDELNLRMRKELNTSGTALGVCNGRRDLGARAETGRKHDMFSRLGEPCGQRFGTSYDEATASYAHFKVSVTLENTISDVGYITEKVVNSFLAESIPIYAGSKHISAMFNPRSFFSLEPGKNDWQVITDVIETLRDETRYTKMMQEKVISDDAMRRFLSWHPAVWPTHGDSLRRRIVGEVLRRCKAHSRGGKLRGAGHS